MKEFFANYPLTDEVIAAGISGGADSMALVLRLKEFGCKVIALTVDHGLRPSSRGEAEYVAKVMEKFGIEHHILTWEGDKPATAIEAAAREARYDLLCSWCQEHGVKVLAVGHHQRDQAETFLLRLQRGSGVYGLSCMQPLTMREGITLIRPQLDDNVEDLRAYLKAKGIDWVDDESNQCEDFMRVKVRNFLPELEAKIGLSEERLAETAKVLSRTRSYLAEVVDEKIKNQVRQLGRHVFAFSPKAVAVWHQEIAYQVLAALLCRAGQKDYPPESEELLRLVADLQRPDFKGCTLGWCEILVAQKRIWIVPELRGEEVMSKAEWQKCLQFVPQYAKAELPYKVRRALYHELMKVSDGQES